MRQIEKGSWVPDLIEAALALPVTPAPLEVRA